MMQHIQRIVHEFSNMTYSAIWQYLLTRSYGEIRSLRHPCTVPIELLKKQLPPKFDHKDIHKKIRIKQKELA
ncbi:MAG: hypothetical protein ACXAEF_10065, partial [Candidatus Thorarchaeota archaeon]